MPDFTWVDYIIIGIVTASLLFGLFRGFLREVISLVSLVLSVVLAVKCAPLLGAEFTWWQSPNVRYLVAFLIIFLAVLVIGFFRFSRSDRGFTIRWYACNGWWSKSS